MPPESTATVVPPSAALHLPAEQRRHADRAGALDDQLARSISTTIASAVSSSLDDDDAVRVAREQLERELARALHRDPVGDREHRGGGHRLAATQRLRVGRARGDLHADHLDLWPRRLDRDRDARAQPAAAHRHHDLGEVRHVLEQLEPERALAGDDVGVVERVHERQAAAARGVPCEVYVPTDAPLAKVEAAREQGATSTSAATRSTSASPWRRPRARDGGLAFAHPFDDPDVVAGQGSLGLELLEDVPDLAKVVVPVAAAGCARARDRGQGGAARGRGDRRAGRRVRALPGVAAPRRAGAADSGARRLPTASR